MTWNVYAYGRHSGTIEAADYRAALKLARHMLGCHSSAIRLERL